jgi:antagonist of KipI
MDQDAHIQANVLVGNSPDAATIEVTILGPEIEFEQETVLAVTGAEFTVLLGNRVLPLNESATAERGAVLAFRERGRGARAYLGVRGGITVPPVLGSRSTHLASRTGGHAGRALKSGDRLPIGSQTSRLPAAAAVRRKRQLPDGGCKLRVVAGPHVDRIGRSALEQLTTTRYALSPQSDRIGYRLDGPRIAPRSGTELISGPLPNGCVQIVPSGQPILLMADHATSGGYPIVAVVISADLPDAGQLAPGDWIEFEECSCEVALAALRGGGNVGG